MACPGGSYSVKYVVYQAVNDSRGCTACTCGAPVPGTCGGTSTLWANPDCSGGNATISHDGVTCVDFVGLMRSLKFQPDNAPQGGACASTGGGQPTGSASPASPRTLCCLP
ncbi:MAG: hypothetical protein HY744_12035 [Deltaproteobacteria bacterium]|nr:hypothetical protein [Deltaproteobacteria bacterium]